MNQKILALSAILFIGLVKNNLNAQESVNSSGGTASGSGGFASYSIGQVAYTNFLGTNGSVAQGVQQPYEISIVTALEDTKDITLSFLAYPNPTTDFIKLKAEKYNTENLTYLLYDLNGKSIENKKMESREATISMENLATGTYFLKVTENNKDLKIFKIVKN